MNAHPTPPSAPPGRRKTAGREKSGSGVVTQGPKEGCRSAPPPGSSPLGYFGRVNTNAWEPLYFQIFQQIEKAIGSGQLKPGWVFPAEPKLCDSFGVSMPTLRRAMADLIARGLIERSKKTGTRVAPGRAPRRHAALCLTVELTEARMEGTENILAAERINSGPEVSVRLELHENSPVQYLRRMLSADGCPVGIIENYCSLIDSSTDPADADSVHLFAHRDRMEATAHQVITARQANASEARLLALGGATTLLVREQVVYDEVGRPIDYERAIYRADAYRASAVTSRPFTTGQKGDNLVQTAKPSGPQGLCADRIL